VSERRKRIGSWSAAAAIGVAIALAGPGTATAQVAGCADDELAFAPGNEARVRAAMLCLVSNERTSRGIPALQRGPQLELAAQRHADDMVARGYFSHTAPAPAPHGADPAVRAAQAGYPPPAGWPTPYVGENIAMSNATARDTVLQWLKSPGHCTNMLRSTYAELGVGVATGPAFQPPDLWPPVWVQVLGSTSGDTTASPASTAAQQGCAAGSYTALVTPAGGSAPGGGSGSDTGSGSGSGTGSTSAKQRITAKLARLARGRYRVTGKVTPRGSTRKVRVRLRRGTRSRSKLATVRASGRFAVTLKAPTGRKRLRLSVTAR